MAQYATENIRTVALVGHGAAGKTTLAEALLVRAKAIQAPGSVERGTSVSDFDPLEKTWQHSLRASVLHLDAGLRVDYYSRSLDGVEGADRLANEIGESGGIEQVHAGAVGIQVKHRRAERVLQGLLQRIEVAHGRAPLHAARRLDHLRACEQRLRERGLARGAVSYQCYGTNILRGVLRHAFLLVVRG